LKETLAYGKRLEDYLPANRPGKEAGVATLISDNVDLKLKLLKRDKNSHFILIKVAIHQEEITILNLYAPNVSTPNFTKQTLKDLKTTYRP
jgi:hypothetical protein